VKVPALIQERNSLEATSFDCLLRSSDSIPAVNIFPNHIGTEMDSCTVLNKILTKRCILVVPMEENISLEMGVY
jgi:hypothetical protein